MHANPQHRQDASYADQTRTCSDCGQEFVWSAGEQEYYASKRLRNPPKRCAPCRQRRRDRER